MGRRAMGDAMGSRENLEGDLNRGSVPSQTDL